MISMSDKQTFEFDNFPVGEAIPEGEDFHHRFSSTDEIVIDEPEEKSPPVRLRYLLEKVPGEEIYNILSYNPRTQSLDFVVDYDHPQLAVDALDRYNGVLTREQLIPQIYQVVATYIDKKKKGKKPDLHQFLLNFIVLFRWEKTWNFQHLLSVYDVYLDTMAADRVKPRYVAETFVDDHYREDPPLNHWDLFNFYTKANPIARVYDALYDLVVLKTGDFNDRKYLDDNLPMELILPFTLQVFRIFKFE
jgi:hypothetical protein